VPVTPGYHGEDQDPSTWPAMPPSHRLSGLIKAVAGGGGKGMRKVEAPRRFLEALWIAASAKPSLQLWRMTKC
jgi:3-methylcrotonyl-CoA carboxylase alpha subunit